MPPSPLIDPDRIDPSQRSFSPSEIRSINPQRHEMEQLDGIISIFEEEDVITGLKEVQDDEFWTRGHLPDQPLMPGCLMVESAAQLCSFWYGHRHRNDDRFIGFGGLEDVSFRSKVTPGEDLVLLAHPIEERSRQMKYQTQGLVGEKVVFAGVIIGMPVPARG